MLDVPVMGEDCKMCIEPWPMLLPKDMMVSLIRAGHLPLIMGSTDDRVEYWKHALKDFPQDRAKIDPAFAAPVAVYGDEVNVFRSPHMCLTWHPTLNIHSSDSMASRFLSAIIPSEKYFIVSWWHFLAFLCQVFMSLLLSIVEASSGVNVTLQTVLRYMTDSLNEVARDGLRISANNTYCPHAPDGEVSWLPFFSQVWNEDSGETQRHFWQVFGIRCLWLRDGQPKYLS